jgi:hypothetical protein
VSEESGLGEKSFYGVSATGAMYIFLKKGKVVGLALGGSPTARANVSKDALLKAAQAAASKI